MGYSRLEPRASLLYTPTMLCRTMVAVTYSGVHRVYPGWYSREVYSRDTHPGTVGRHIHTLVYTTRVYLSGTIRVIHQGILLGYHIHHPMYTSWYTQAIHLPYVHLLVYPGYTPTLCVPLLVYLGYTHPMCTPSWYTWVHTSMCTPLLVYPVHTPFVHSSWYTRISPVSLLVEVTMRPVLSPFFGRIPSERGARMPL